VAAVIQFAAVWRLSRLYISQFLPDLSHHHTDNAIWQHLPLTVGN